MLIRTLLQGSLIEANNEQVNKMAYVENHRGLG